MKKMMMTVITVALAFGLALSAEAQGQRGGGGQGLGHLLKQADKDGNGQITLDEAKTVLPNITDQRFKMLDRNGDGVLSRADRPAPGEPGAAAGPEGAGKGRGLLARADTNGDGKVTYEEAVAAAPQMTQERFGAIDTNRDGVLTTADRPQGKAPRLAELLRRADKDGSGAVTFDELTAVAPRMTRERFDTIDTNRDGVITSADKPAPGATGQGGKPGPAAGANAEEVKKLKEADANQDGKVTYEEVAAARPGFPKESFDRYDINRDGVLTAADRQNTPMTATGDRAERARMFLEKLRASDSNGDQKVTYEEASAKMPKLTKEVFTRLDRNGDGAISAEDRKPTL